MPTLDEMHKRIFGDVKPEETNLRCPISGDILMALPVERGVMDPMYLYEAKNNPEYRYGRHPFSWSIFTQYPRGSNGWFDKGISYWRLEDDGSWTKMIHVKELSGKLFVDGTPRSEINAEIKKEKERLEERRKYLAEQPEEALNFPTFTKILAKTITQDLVPVKPMSIPEGKTFYIDSKVNDEPRIVYPYLVTEENLQETIEKWTLPIHNWGKENLINFEKFGTIQTGDTIDELVTGGALSMRHYEHVVRNGEIIYKRLIAMS